MSRVRSSFLSPIVLVAFLAGGLLAIRPIDGPRTFGRKHRNAWALPRPKGRSRPDALAREPAFSPLPKRRIGGPATRVLLDIVALRPTARAAPGRIAARIPGMAPPRSPLHLRC